MARKIIELERSFSIAVRSEMDGGKTDWSVWARGRRTGADDWSSVLENRRAVILAEAGSGKSVEMRAQTVKIREAGKFAFYVTVQDVGNAGLIGAMRAPVVREFEAWKASDNPAWFFVDSVDEGRLKDVALTSALGQIADLITGAERRAHIVLSSRYSDWDFEADFADFAQILQVAPETVPEPPSEEILRHALKNSPLPEPVAPEPPVVYLMVPLDEPKVRLFAKGSDIRDVDAFVSAIEAGDLWRFARRPRDLEWMADYWRSHKALGTLAEMYEASLSARLREDGQPRMRDSSLTLERSWEAIERVGAAMIFGRASTVAIPSVEVSLDKARGALNLEDVLPNWTQEDVRHLLSTAVFDPATFGRSRLHNDNEGSVSAYLAARWLRRLKGQNCPDDTIRRLLFADIYDNSLIKASCEATAAWLSLWDRDVAREVLERDPTILLNMGDPGTLSLEMRIETLCAVVLGLTRAPNQRALLFSSHEIIRRFATLDMADAIRANWMTHGHVDAVRHLLLLMIDLGKIGACVDLVVPAALVVDDDAVGRVFAARATCGLGDAATKAQLADHILANADRLPGHLVWEVADRLFPQHISIAKLVGLLGQELDTSGVNLADVLSRMASRLFRPADLTEFMNGLVACGRLAPEPEIPSEDIYTRPIRLAALRLLQRADDRTAPAAAIEAYFWTHRDRYANRRDDGEDVLIKDELKRTAPRRQTTFWQASISVQHHKYMGAHPINNVMQIEWCGWPGGLQLADLPWLFADGKSHTDTNLKELAVSAMRQVWQNSGADPATLAQIQAGVADDPVLVALVENYFLPVRLIREASDFEDKMATQHAEHVANEERRERGWRDFISDMQARADEIARLPPPTPETVDPRLFDLWRFASSVCGDQNRFGFSDLTRIEPLYGPELTEAIRRALIAFWPHWKPTLSSQRPVAERNVTSRIDVMAMTGIGLAATESPHWAEALSDDEARQAAEFATLELGGFPSWLPRLAAAHSDSVGYVLSCEIALELADETQIHRSCLEKVRNAEPSVASHVAPQLLVLLIENPGWQAAMLDPVLDIVLKGEAAIRQRLADLSLQRGATDAAIDRAGSYIATAFIIDPIRAVEVLETRLDALAAGEQTQLALHVLPKLFGPLFGRRPAIADLPFVVLARLVRIAYATIRIDEDLKRPSGKVYSPTIRDDAESARYGALRQMAGVPGLATYDELLTMSQESNPPVSASHLRELALARAYLDAEDEPWSPADVIKFENDHETAPKTGAELQRLALGRIKDIQSQLLTDDFKQDQTFRNLTPEREVQKWVADRFKSARKQSYDVQRESHRADEKPPDLVLTAKASYANVAIEIKVVDTNSGQQLLDALVMQLCGRYLRDPGGRHGVILLVHQKRRVEGWVNPESGQMMTFPQLLEWLRAKAHGISAASPDAPQPVVAVLDVSEASGLE